MPLILPGNVASATASTTYDVDNSCRFNDGDDAYMHKTPGGAGNRRKFTFSTWLKRSNITLGSQALLFAAGGDTSNWTIFRITTTDGLQFSHFDGGSTIVNLITSLKLRDPSAWYHIVWAIDTEQATEANRAKLYVNGTQVTAFGTETYPAEDKDLDISSTEQHYIGGGQSRPLDGYLAETVFIDGLQLAPTSFGEFDSDSPTIWKPIDVSGLTFGTNGFYLDFEASDNLGNDANGGTDLTEVNLDATDQATDTPTNNFCTMNPLFDGNGLWSSDIAVDGRTSEGNCKVSGGEHMPIMGTMAIGQMKTYYECHVADYDVAIGYMATTPNGGVSNSFSDAMTAAVYVYDLGGSVVHGGNWTATDNLTSAGNYMFAIDPAAGKMWFGKDGIWTGDPAAGSGNSFSSISTAHEQIPYFHTLKSSYGIASANFGGCSSFTVSSANQDANGYGNFEYAVPSGFYALCTKNLAEFGG